MSHHAIANPAARPLLDPFLPVLQARAIMAGVELGVFEALSQGPRRTSDLAGILSLDADALGMLLRVLAGTGYLSRSGEKFSLTELSQAAFLSQSPTRLCSWARFNYIHWRMIGRMEEVLRTGEGIGTHEFLKGETDWAIQQEAMLETARPAAPWVAARVPVREGARRLLDLGGSHGLYGGLISRAHPPMRAEVLESPDAVEHARKLARQEGINDVVTHRAGNALTCDLGAETLDVAFLGNMVHHFTAGQNQDLLRRIGVSLRSSGTVAIWDFRCPEPDAEEDLVADGFALLFRITSAARCYRPSEIVDWLEAAGFVSVRIQAAPVSTHLLITARRP